MYKPHNDIPNDPIFTPTKDGLYRVSVYAMNIAPAPHFGSGGLVYLSWHDDVRVEQSAQSQTNDALKSALEGRTY